MSQEPLDREAILQMSGGFMPACVIGAAAELDVFTALGEDATSADALASRLRTDGRATAMLLDALAALGLLDKRDGLYFFFRSFTSSLMMAITLPPVSRAIRWASSTTLAA